jgi:uncharacterized protein with HEPN domain
MQFNGVTENLQISKASELRKHTKLFETADNLRKQRDRIVHSYGLPNSSLKWTIIWHTVNSRLQKELLPELENVIQKELRNEGC